MAEENGERVETGVDENESREVEKLYKSLEKSCRDAGMENKWDEIQECLTMVDKSMTEKNNDYRERKRRKNGELDLVHPVRVTLKTIEIAKRHPDIVRLDEELVEGAVLHDYFEDYDYAPMIFVAGYRGGVTKAARVMGIAHDVSKATIGDKLADGSPAQANLRKQSYEDKLKQEKMVGSFETKNQEDEYLLKHVDRRAASGDLRPLVIKIADRIHNLETVDGLIKSGDHKYDAFNRMLAQTISEFVPLALKYGLTTEAQEMRKLIRDAQARKLKNEK